MQFPRPILREYAKFTVTVLLVLAVLQYAGVFFEDPGTIDWVYLASAGVTLPLFAYVLSVLAENVRWLPNWEGMNRTDQQ